MVEEYEETVNNIVSEAFNSSYKDFKNPLVIYPLTTRKHVEYLKYLLITNRSRKFVFLIGLTAPVLSRHKRFCKHHFDLPLDKFIELDDSINCGLAFSSAEVSTSIAYSDHNLHNPTTEEAFIEALKKVDFINREAVRPGWDTYFLQVAELVSRRSNCVKRTAGAILVCEKKILFSGYTGTPFGIDNCNKGGCEQCLKAGKEDKGLDTCFCIHAEMNAVFEMGRIKLDNITLYSTIFPCILCTKAIIQAGIKRVVYTREYTRTKLALELFKAAEVKIEQHSPFVISKYLNIS